MSKRRNKAHKQTKGKVNGHARREQHKKAMGVLASAGATLQELEAVEIRKAFHHKYKRDCTKADLPLIEKKNFADDYSSYQLWHDGTLLGTMTMGVDTETGDLQPRFKPTQLQVLK